VVVAFFVFRSSLGISLEAVARLQRVIWYLGKNRGDTAGCWWTLGPHSSTVRCCQLGACGVFAFTVLRDWPVQVTNGGSGLGVGRRLADWPASVAVAGAVFSSLGGTFVYEGRPRAGESGLVAPWGAFLSGSWVCFLFF